MQHKRLNPFHQLTMMLVVVVGFMLAACAPIQPNNTPAQNALNTTAQTCRDIVAAINAADAAVAAGVLKGDNARTAVRGLEAAQTGCRTALTAFQAAQTAAAASAPK